MAIRILVVDDSVVIRKLLTSTLNEVPGLEVVATAALGSVALTKIAQIHPDIVILDVEMPEMDGIETLKRIRREAPRLPVIMFSTKTERGATATIEALTSGASDYVTKPSNAGNVLLAMQRVREEMVPKILALTGKPTTMPAKPTTIPPPMASTVLATNAQSAAATTVLPTMPAAAPPGLPGVAPMPGAMPALSRTATRVPTPVPDRGTVKLAAFDKTAARLAARDRSGKPGELGMAPLERPTVGLAPLDRATIGMAPLERSGEPPAPRPTVGIAPLDRATGMAPLDRGTIGMAPLDRGTVGIAPLARPTVGIAPLDRATVGIAPLARPTVGIAPLDRATVGIAPLARPASPTPGPEVGRGISIVMDGPIRLMRATDPRPPIEIIAIGASTGGPNALVAMLAQLPADFPVPIVIVQHMLATFTRPFADRLAAQCKLRIIEASAGDALTPGHAYIARGGYHLVVERRHGRRCLNLNQDEVENFCRPAVDVLFRSVAQTYGASALAIVLTGMGHDGLHGCGAIRDAGGDVIVQDEASSVVWGMPGFVARAGLASSVMPIEQLGSELRRRVALGGPRGGDVGP